MTSRGLWAFVVETRTGNVVEKRLPFSPVPRAGFRINTEGPCSITVPMSKSFSRSDIAYFLYPWRFSFGVAIGSFIIQCGPLTDNPEYDPESESWTLDCAGLLRIWNTKRFLLTQRNYTGFSYHDMARSLMFDDMTQTNGDLPVDLPALNGLGGVGEVYSPSRLPAVGELLRDLTDADSGIELELRPQFVDPTTCDVVRWSTQIGAPYLGRTDRQHRWYSNKSLVRAAPAGGGARIADRYLVPGQSNGDTSVYGQCVPWGPEQSLADHGWPLLMDLDAGHTSETDPAVLTGYANANFAALHAGPKRITARVRANPPEGQGPRLGEWQLGDVGVFPIRGYLGTPNADYRCRILGADLVSVDDVDLELQVLSEVPG